MASKGKKTIGYTCNKTGGIIYLTKEEAIAKVNMEIEQLRMTAENVLCNELKGKYMYEIRGLTELKMAFEILEL